MRRAFKYSCALTAATIVYAFILRTSSALFEQHRALLIRIFYALGRVCARFATPVAEIAAFALCVCLITLLIFALIKSLATRSFAHIRRFIAMLLCAALPIVGIFNLIWPVRMDAAAHAAYERAYPLAELQQLIQAFDSRLRADEAHISFDSGHMKLSTDFDELARNVAAAYEAAGFKIAASPKAARQAAWLDLIHAAGIFIPFTGESIVSPNELDCALPFTMLHETAHSLGAFREDEANLIALKVGLASNSAELRWSCALTALRYSLNTLRALDEDLFNEALHSVSPNARRELELIGTFTLTANAANARAVPNTGRVAAVSAHKSEYFARINDIGAYDGVVYLLLHEGYGLNKGHPLPAP